jgi:hypothetical protein
MHTAQLKDMVIDKIYGINDEDYLKAIKKILDMRTPSRDIYQLNKKQKAMINEGRQQISNNKYISNEELEREEDRWLSE